MRIASFLWDKILEIVFCLAGAVATSVFLLIAVNIHIAAPVFGAWIGALIIYLAAAFLIQTQKLRTLRELVRSAEDKFLLSEIVPLPKRSEDAFYYELMRIQGRAAIDKVMQGEREKADYYDYLCKWAHEIKAPIAAIGLICDKENCSQDSDIMLQLSRINNSVESMLYEVRSNNTEKDLMIKSVDIRSLLNELIVENKQLFISSGVSIEVEAQGCVYSDEKWLGFIIKQILFNSVQYAKSENAKITIRTEQLPQNKTILHISDNGIGIEESDIKRIFDKGFTGKNGRKNRKSTGFGLYLVKKLCGVLDIGITASSKSGEYTQMSLELVNNAAPLCTVI